ncbi:MAG: flagellar biosynthetic protein FliR [Gammaproteobacteria bacterium]|nr:flagellar biosynthetic protein FliR [Gammaproteobacteria bacterium]
MELSITEINAWVGGFLWPFLRISAMFVSAPLFSSRMIPLKVRLLIGLLLSLMIEPMILSVPATEPLSPEGLLISAHQVLIGLGMGFILQLIFSAFALAGEVVAMSMGLGFASMIDPQNGVQIPVLSSYYVVLVTLIFLALNGHLSLIVMIMESFQSLPIGVHGVGVDGVWQIVAWASAMFSGAVLVALPALISLLMVNLAFSMITRTAPQLNIFAVGFPMTLMLGFIFILFSVPALELQVPRLLTEGYELMSQILDR